MFRAALASNLATGWVIFGVRIALVPLFVVTALEGDTAATAVALTVFAVGKRLGPVALGTVVGPNGAEAVRDRRTADLCDCRR